MWIGTNEESKRHQVSVFVEKEAEGSNEKAERLENREPPNSQ